MFLPELGYIAGTNDFLSLNRKFQLNNVRNEFKDLGSSYIDNLYGTIQDPNTIYELLKLAFSENVDQGFWSYEIIMKFRYSEKIASNKYKDYNALRAEPL